MKIKVLSDRAVITDNVPIITDLDNFAEIEVETSDDSAYAVNFAGRVMSSKEPVKNGKVRLPKCYFADQLLSITILRCRQSGITPLPCGIVKIYSLQHAERMMMCLENAAPESDLRDIAAAAAVETDNLKKELSELTEKHMTLKSEFEKRTEELKKVQTEFSEFLTLYNENISKTNELIRRVENMEADYDMLVK